MTNKEIRQWYLNRIAAIAELNETWIQQGHSAYDRARAAWRIRHENRLAARAMMLDSAETELLRVRDMAKYSNPDGPTFEQLIKQARNAGLEGDDAYEAIIVGSYRTNEGINKKFDL
ncbi:MAG: hypothetical protein ABI977_35170 [Acidobacteriota bacterium]